MSARGTGKRENATQRSIPAGLGKWALPGSRVWRNQHICLRKSWKLKNCWNLGVLIGGLSFKFSKQLHKSPQNKSAGTKNLEPTISGRQERIMAGLTHDASGQFQSVNLNQAETGKPHSDYYHDLLLHNKHSTRKTKLDKQNTA